MYLENSQILTHNRSPPSNGFVSSWPMPVTGGFSSCAWRTLKRPRAIGQRFYGMNVSIVSYRYSFWLRSSLIQFYGYRKDNTEPFVKYNGSNGGQKPCNLWTTKANALDIDILALTWRVGGSSLWMGTCSSKSYILEWNFSLQLSRSLILGNWIRSWLSTISPILL